MGMSDPLETHPYTSQVCYHSKFSRSYSNGCRVITQIIRKTLVFRVPPFKVTQGHWNRHGSIG